MRASLQGSGCSAPKPGGSSHGPSYGASQRVRPAALGYAGSSSTAGRSAKAAEAQGVSRHDRPQVDAVGIGPRAGPVSRIAALDPVARPGRPAPEIVQAILTARVERRWGPHRLGPLLGQPRSTIYAVLARAGLLPVARCRSPLGRPGPLRPRSPGLARPPGPQEAGPDPDGGGHRVARPRERHPRSASRSGLRPLRGRGR